MIPFRQNTASLAPEGCAWLHGAITTGFSPWQCRTESRGSVEQCGCPSRARDVQEPHGSVCIAPTATGTQNIKHPLAGCQGISLPGFKYICHTRHLIHCGKLVYSLTCRWRVAGLAPSWELGAAGTAAVEEGISAHQHVCCPTARHKTLLWEFSTLAGIPFPCPQTKILFSKPCEDFFHSSIQLTGSWDQKGAHRARGAAGGVEGG